MRSAFFMTLLISIGLLMSPSVTAQSADDSATIMDDLTVFLHTGPSRNYRITGTIVAGSPITILAREGDPEFVQISDDEGRTGWVEARFISTSGSIRAELPALRQAINDVRASNTTLQQQNQRLREENATLTQQSQRLAQQLEGALQEQQTLQEQLQRVDQKEMIEWFTRGGIVAVVCILLGILITFIPKKRRRNDQWMN